MTIDNRLGVRDELTYNETVIALKSEKIYEAYLRILKEAGYDEASDKQPALGITIWPDGLMRVSAMKQNGGPRVEYYTEFWVNLGEAE